MRTLGAARFQQAVIERLNRLRPDSPSRWGKMSAHQMVCHLADSFKVPLGEKPVSPAPPVGPQSLLRWVALYAPVPWPRAVPTRPEIDQLAGGTQPTTFDGDRRDLIRTIERFTAAPQDFTWHPHPMFGDMSQQDWMRWGYLHAHHHLRQFGV